MAPENLSITQVEWSALFTFYLGIWTYGTFLHTWKCYQLLKIFQHGIVSKHLAVIMVFDMLAEEKIKSSSNTSLLSFYFLLSLHDDDSSTTDSKQSERLRFAQKHLSLS